MATSHAQAPVRAPDRLVIRGWNIQPAIGVSISHTDNLFVTVVDEVDENIGQIVPSISIEYSGLRATLDFDYQLQVVAFEERSDFDEVFHELMSAAELELVQERLFLDLDANFFQQVIDPEERLRFNTLAPTGNFADSLVAAVMPRAVQPLGRAAELQLSYTSGIVDYSGPDQADALEDSDYSGGEVVVQSPADAGRLSWRALYSNREVDYETATDFQFEEAYLELGYDVSSATRVIALGGYDSDVERDISAGGLDEPRWEVGVRWQGGRRNQLEAFVGERFFGSTYRFLWSYTGQRLFIDLEYDEGPTTLAEEEIARPESFLASGPVFDNVPLGIEVEPFIEKAGSLTIGLAGARNNLDLTLYAGEQEFIETDEQSRGRRAVLEWERRLGPVTTLFSSVDWQRIQIRETQDFFEVWFASVSLDRDISPSITARLLLRHERRTADVPENEYRENAISLGLVKWFGGTGGNRQRSFNFSR